jgi:hypothetical protein
MTNTIWRVPILAWIPISAAIVAETVSNALRAYGLGTHLEKFTVSYAGVSVSLAGAVLVLAAVAVSLSQARAAWLALMPGPWRQRIVAGVAGVLLLAVSITAMSTHILEAERAKAGAEGGQSGSYERTLADYTTKKAELDKLADVRPIEAVKALMDSAPVPRNVFRRTAECTDVTRDDSFGACKPILDLRQEMGLAIRKRSLEPEVAALKAALDGQAKPEVASATEATVAWWWAWLMGVAVVFIATFGAVIWAKPVESVTAATATKSTDAAPLDTAKSAATQMAGLSDEQLADLRSRFLVEDESVTPEPPSPKPRKRGKSKRSQRKEDVIAKIRAQTLAGKKPSFSVVRARFKLPKSTASRYLREATAG